jgi:hypothetical protein
MIDLNVLLMALTCLVIVWCFDRFILCRGVVTLNSCVLHDSQNGYWRFALSYTIKSPIFWGEIRYSLRDKSNPSTVISGKARNLDHAVADLNVEFLHIKESLTATSTGSGEWELRIVTNTVVGHWNPLYKYLPLSISKTFKVALYNGE